MRISDWSSDVCSSDLLAGRAPLAILKIVMSDRIECARCWSNYSLSCHTTALGWIKTEELYMTEQFSVRPLGGGMSALLYDDGLRRHMLQAYNYMGLGIEEIGRASCRERVCQHV